ncbi:MAG: two-component system sensor histidine kinase NtrB [Desulfobaccales bacterium]
MARQPPAISQTAKGAQMMKFFSQMTFRTKINLGITVVVLVFGLLSAFLVSRLASQAMLTEIKKRGITLVLNLGSRSTDPLLAQDFLRLKNMVDEVKESSDDIIYAFIQDHGGQVLSHSFQADFPVQLLEANILPSGALQKIQLLDTDDDFIYDFAVSVQIGAQRLGTVHVGLSREKAQAAVQRLVNAVFAVTAGAALIALVMGTLFAGTVTRRLDILRRSAEEMVKGNMDQQTGLAPRRYCWEIMDCGKRECPAYGDRLQRCWNLSGTLCPQCGKFGSENKIEDCQVCRVYLENRGDEIQKLAEAFEVMACSLRNRLEELRAAQKGLARQQQVMKTILDATPDLVSLQDQTLAYRAANPAFLNFYALKEEELIGQAHPEISRLWQEADPQGEDRGLFDTGGTVSKEVFIGQGPEQRWFHVVKVPVHDEERVVGLLFTARDITEIKRYQEKLIQSVKMEELGKLAGGVAHEINTPLAIILGYAQMLLEDLPQDSESHEFLTIIEKQAQICRRIVSDLLSFSRHMESHMEEMDLNLSLSEVLQILKPIFKQEWVEVEASLDPGMPPIIGDREKLKQVWLNLLNNAFESIGQNGRIRVATGLSADGRRALVTVADTGAGIDPQDLEKIFDPFFSTKAPGGGTGLGLSLSFGIIREHRGQIRALSPVPPEYLGENASPPRAHGPGAVFLLELPLDGEETPEFASEALPAPATALAE